MDLVNVNVVVYYTKPSTKHV